MMTKQAWVQNFEWGSPNFWRVNFFLKSRKGEGLIKTCVYSFFTNLNLKGIQKTPGPFQIEFALSGIYAISIIYLGDIAAQPFKIIDSTVLNQLYHALIGSSWNYGFSWTGDWYSTIFWRAKPPKK